MARGDSLRCSRKPRVQLKIGLYRTKGKPTSVPTTRPQTSKVSCAVGPARPGGELKWNRRGRQQAAPAGRSDRGLLGWRSGLLGWRSASLGAASRAHEDSAQLRLTGPYCADLSMPPVFDHPVAEPRGRRPQQQHHQSSPRGIKQKRNCRRRPAAAPPPRRRQRVALIAGCSAGGARRSAPPRARTRIRRN